MLERKWWWCGSGWVLCAAALAETPVAAEAVEPLRLPQVLGSSLVVPGAGGRPTEVLDLGSSRSGLSIVQLANEGLPGDAPRRPSLAVRFGLESPRQWLRGLGVEASECTGVLRPPARRPGDADSGSIEAGLRAAVRCKF